MNDTANRAMAHLPLFIASIALASVFWLLLVSVGQALNARVEYNESVKKGYYYSSRQEVQVLPIVLMLAVAVSAFVSLGLIITSFCFWPRHVFTGKVLTVSAAVLFLPFLCCGVGLGII